MLLTALIFFVILSLLVFVHELGHYSVAKWIGVKVEEFGFGLPPRIWGKKIGETIYSVNWLPIGGFVKLAGEDDPDSQKAKAKGQSIKHFFWARSKKERIAILLAGVTMNFLLAWGITGFLLTQGINEPSGRVHVERVLPGSPAEQIGLQKGDIIVSVGIANDPTLVVQPKITIPNDLIDYVKQNAGTELVLTISRRGQVLVLKVIPRKNPPPGQGALGVAVSDLEQHVYPVSHAPLKSLEINALRVKEMFTGLGTVIARLAQLKPIEGDIAGPIGIAKITGDAVKIGWQAVLEFMSILSLNLAVINILPIPALDGGRVAFIFVEKLLGRKVRPAFEQSAHQIGMIILLILVALISLNDIFRLARGG